MNTKNIIILIVVLAVLGGGYWFYTIQKTVPVVTDQNGRMASPTGEVAPGKLKAANFEGKLEQVSTGCFADGECYVVVDGKHVTTTIGWSQAVVGTIQGVESFGDLEKHIGEQIEVYANDKGDGTYSLYGSEGFYVKLK